MVPEPIQNLGTALASDRFEGYAAEPTELLKFINDNNIDNVVFVAADIHGTLVNNLTYQEEFGGEQIATNTFEITTGSVAFEPAFGPSVISLVNLPPEQQTFYENLPVANDTDSEINDKDDFLKSILNQELVLFDYDPIGLNDNLETANNKIDATLVQGDYLATHTFGWTQFEIDPDTQQLRVVTYGVDPYTEEELLTNPEEVIDRELRVVSEFVVNPTETIPPVDQEIIGTPDDDRLDGEGGNDTITGLADNDTLVGSDGDDEIIGSRGDDFLYGNDGNDTLEGRPGFDFLFGGDGDDEMNGGIGRVRVSVA